jgi:hypothetical protein
VLVRTKAFVDGLKKRSATKSVQVFNFDHATDRWQWFIPGMVTLPIWVKRSRVKLFASSIETAI